MFSRNNLLRLPLFLFAISAPVSVTFGNLFCGLILVMGFLVLVLRRDQVFPQSRLIVISLFLFLGIQFLATCLASPLPVNWSQFFEESWIKLLIVAVPLLCSGKPEYIENVIKTMIAVSVFVSIYACFQHFTGVDFVRSRSTPVAGDNFLATGFFSHHLTYGGQVLVLLIYTIAWALYGKSTGRHQVLLPYVAVLTLSLALFWSGARSAVLGAIVGTGFLTSMLRARARNWAWLGLILAILLGSMIPSVRMRCEEMFVDGSQTTRNNLWRSSSAGILDKPVLGWGQGNFGEMMEQHKADGSYDTTCHAHNDFLMMAVNAGIPGLVSGLALSLMLAVVLWRKRKAVVGPRWIILGAVCMQLSIAVAGLFQVYQTDDEVEMVLYFLLGCALALSQGSLSATRR